MPTDPVELHHRFHYHPPLSTEVARTLEDVREACWRLANWLNDNLPDGREKQQAFTHLEQTMFWANAAVARQQRKLVHEPYDPTQ